jgi:ABC-type Zn2+ transport system substrate-binding protein/surface adhesin
LRIDLKIKVHHLYKQYVNNSNNDNDNSNNHDDDDDHHHKHDDEDEDDDIDYYSIRTAPCTQPNFYAAETTGKSCLTWHYIYHVSY